MFHDYGGKKRFHGPAMTLKVFEDNSLVRDALEQDGKGRVLVIDGGGSLRCALVGDNLAQLGKDNNWSGIIIFGCITNPTKSLKKGAGEKNITVKFADISINPDDYIYADEDGFLRSPEKLL